MKNIALADYQNTGFDAFDGFAGDQAAQDLIKAMQAGQTTGRDTTNQLLTQEPLKAESLEKTLKLLEFRMQDIKLWNSVPKLPAYNTVEEFLQLESYGTNRGGFYNEGELSDVEDSKYRRRAELVKFIQVTGEVTYQAQLVRSYVDAMRKEVENKTMWVVRKVNESLTKADSDIVPQEFNSIYKQHASIGSQQGDLYATLEDYFNSNTVIDLRGKSITQEDIEEGAIRIDDNFGNIDTFFAPPSVISGLSRDYFQRQRILLNAPSSPAYNGVIGTTPKAIGTSFGDVALMHDKFMKADPSKTIASNATSDKAPNAPTVSAQTLSGADTQSKFVAGESHTGELGTVFYAVSAVNRYGESGLTVFNNTTKVTLTAGQSVDLTFTAGGGANPATGYVIYRTKVTSSTNATTDNVVFYPIFKVSAADLASGYDGAAALSVRDRNRFLPDTEQGFASEMTEDVMSFKQLAPISKMDLAILGMSRRFITFLFGTPQLYTPKKVVRYVNIGPFIS